jgi:hypothetical protein
LQRFHELRILLLMITLYRLKPHVQAMGIGQYSSPRYTAPRKKGKGGV